MRRLLIMFLIAAAAVQGYKEFFGRPVALAEDQTPSDSVPTPAVQFRCDGRTHCSQMTSCAEATYFLRNCPDTKMDGDHDGIPCEQQWCGR